MRAYSGAVQAALDHAELAPLQSWSTVRVTVPWDCVDVVERLVSLAGARDLARRFGERAVFEFDLPSPDAEQLDVTLRDGDRGTVRAADPAPRMTTSDRSEAGRSYVPALDAWAFLVHRALWVRGLAVPQVGLDARGADPVELVARGLEAGWPWPVDGPAGGEPTDAQIDAVGAAALTVLRGRRRRMLRERPRAQWFDAVNTQGFARPSEDAADEPVDSATRMPRRGRAARSGPPPLGDPTMAAGFGSVLDQLPAITMACTLLEADGRARHRIAALLGIGEERVERECARGLATAERGWTNGAERLARSAPSSARELLARAMAQEVPLERLDHDPERTERGLRERLFRALMECAVQLSPLGESAYGQAARTALRRTRAKRRRAWVVGLLLLAAAATVAIRVWSPF